MIRGWRRVGLGICKVGVVRSGSNLAPWITCSAVRTISKAVKFNCINNSQHVFFLFVFFLMYTVFYEINAASGIKDLQNYFKTSYRPQTFEW